MSMSVKKIIIGVLAAAIVLDVGAIIHECNTTYTKTEKEVVYQYGNKGEATYKVYLKPNQFYEESTQDEGNYYINKYIDHFDITLGDEFKGSKETEIEGNYQVTLTFRGYMEKFEGQENKKFTVWSKKKDLVKPVQFKEKSSEHKISETISLSLAEYEQFVRKMSEKEEISMPTEVIITLQGEKNVHAPQEDVKLPIYSQVTIPVGEQIFQVEKAVSEPIEEMKQERDKTIILPLNHKLIIAEAVSGVIAFIAGILIIFFIKVRTEKEEKERKQLKVQKRIFIEWGARLVGVENLDEGIYKNIYHLHTMEDMIKVADELEKPILYMKDDNPQAIHIFYLIDQETLYRFEIEVPQVKEETKEIQFATERDKIVSNDEA